MPFDPVSSHSVSSHSVSSHSVSSHSASSDQFRDLPSFLSVLHPAVAAELETPPEESLLITMRSSTDADVAHLGQDHPLDWLTATLTPDDCEGLVVISPGTVRSSSPTHHHPSIRPGGQRVLAVQEVLATGRSRLWICEPGLPPSASDSSGAGLVPDAMKRALGLPTNPPDSPVGWYWAAAWLADVFALASEADPHVVASWHPAIDPRELAPQTTQTLPSFVLQRHRQHGLVSGWSVVRDAALDGWLDIGSCPPSLAAWFDDGSFSRFLADQLPSPSVLLDTADALLTPDARAVVSAVLLDTFASVPHVHRLV